MKLAEALTIVQKTVQKPPAGAKLNPVLLACGFSALHLKTFLGAHLQSAALNESKRVEIVTGLYGSLAETLEQIPSFACDAGALFVEWADLDPRLGYRSLGGWGNSISGAMISVESTLARMGNAITRKPPAFRLAVSLPTLALPPGFHTVGWQASAAELEIEGALGRFAQNIALVPGVLVLNQQRLAYLSPAQERYDFRSDLNAGFPYSLKHADVLAGAMAQLLSLPAPKKGLISDLDNTLWRGIVGEDGPEGVAWDLAGHAQIHGLYQQMLQSLADQGVLLGIASKNNAETAERALERPDLAVKRDKFFPAEIHWDAKSGSVSRILKTWNIGADSVVFVDDSPMELEEVRAAHPGMECILFPKNDYAGAFALLQRLRDLFGKPALSQEDTLRLDSIRNSRQFLENAGNEDWAEQFLSSAEATVTFEFNPSPHAGSDTGANAGTDTRVLELVNKTNQFNLNGRRFTAAEWNQLTSAPGAIVAAIAYQDKFGPLGKIAVICGQQHDGTLTINAWVMSCRAFSRRIEYQVLKQTFARTGVQQINFEYLATPKNGPIGDFLKSILGTDKALPPCPSITSEAFAAKCPKLYHQVAFNTE